MPLFKSEPVAEENKIVFELTNEINDMHVVDPVVFVPVTEVAENGVIRHSLEEYMEVENDFVATKTIEKVAEVVPEELNITMKKMDESTIVSSEFESISPMEMTIEETLRARADERRRKLKEVIKTTALTGGGAQLKEKLYKPSKFQCQLTVSSPPHRQQM